MTIAVLGALVVAAVAVVLVVPLVRQVARDQSRAELVRAVETLATSPRISAQLVVREQQALGPDDRRYGLLEDGGDVLGGVGPYLTEADVTRARRTGTLSTHHRVDGREYLVEARAIERGALARRGLVVVAVQPTGGVAAATGALVRRVALALLLGLLAAGLASAVLSRRMAARVREAAARAHRLAEGARGLPDPEPSQVAEVDEMTAALTALDQALVTSEARQREFLLSISHDLRTPLTAVRGYAEALRDGAVPPERIAEVGATLTAETVRLDEFIADLLALARLEADDFRLAAAPTDFGELLTEAASAWRASAESCGVVLTVAEASGPVRLDADARRVRQLVDGLVENALRVTPAGGAVTLAARLAAGEAELTVTDTGPGLRAGEHEHAFERGYLRDRYAAHRSVGTGLGLSIAQRLAQRMGGTLTAEPANPGGTTMRLRLPHRLERATGDLPA